MMLANVSMEIAASFVSVIASVIALAVTIASSLFFKRKIREREIEIQKAKTEEEQNAAGGL